MINVLLDEHHEILNLLNKYKVKYILVGGYAVIHYGYERTTGDMDIWIEASNENKYNIVNALSEYGIDRNQLRLLQSKDFTKQLEVIKLGSPPRSIDFLTLISNVKFEDAYAHSNWVKIENIVVPIIHYNDLILSKITSNRLKDKADIEELQRINKFKK